MNRVKFKIIILMVLSIGLWGCEDSTLDVELFGSIQGVVLSASDNTPLEGVSISTTPASAAVLTDAEGMFTLNKVPLGDVTVAASLKDYIQASISVKVLEDETSTVEFTLEKEELQGSVIFSIPAPVDGMADTDVAIDLSWHTEIEKIENVTYDVFMFDQDAIDKTLIVENLEDTTYTVSGLFSNTTYHWYVVANKDDKTWKSDTWSFRTLSARSLEIVFARKVDGNYQLMATDINGDQVAQLTKFSNNRNWFPLINPQYVDQLLYTSNADGDHHIYTCDRDGKNVQRVTDLPNEGYFNNGEGICWSPDGKRILFSSYSKLYSIKKDGTDLKLIKTAPEGRHFIARDWNKYTGKILVETVGEKSYDSEIYMMDGDGSNFEMLVDNLPGHIGEPSFSIDGKQLLYTRDMSELQSTDGRQLDVHIFLKTLATAEEEDLSTQKPLGTNDINPRFSVTGGSIIFVNTNNTGTEQRNIQRIALDENDENDVDNNGRSLIVADGEMPFWGIKI
ncbi:hypothetical protein EYV94_06455 [Puteibacter caeruleilacunae]|nr:hypothetical protein EYV94_06455 [Puteibacter caeruleilacunae]